MRGRHFAGIVLLLVGVGLLLDAADVMEFRTVWGTYWPLLLVALGIVLIASHPRRPVGGIVVLVVGAILLSSRLDYLPANWTRYAWALAVIAIALLLLFRPGRQWGRRRDHDHWGPKETTDSNTINLDVLFSGSDQDVRASEFRGGRVDVTFGGARIDLRQAQLSPEGARLKVNATFGGVDIFVPSSWHVVVNARPFLGGVRNATIPASPGAARGPVLEVDGSATFGGIEVKN